MATRSAASTAGPPLSSGASPSPLAAPVLTVAAVARRLGVAPATLRTWDRRYGVGPSEHTAGAHRRYTTADVSRLSLMRRLTLEGFPPAEAAARALAATPDDLASADAAVDLADAPLDGSGGSAPSASAGSASAGSAPAPASPSDRSGTPGNATRPADDQPRPTRRRAGGGHVIALPQAEPAARGLARAAMSLDALACVDLLEASVRERGVVATWNELIVPVLVSAGERWAVTGQGIDVEHVLSECVMAVMRGVPATRREDAGRPALLAGTEREQHILPLHVLAAALAEHGVAVRLLGARVPREALAAAVRRSGPAAVFLWAQMPGTGGCEQLGEIPTLRPAPRVVVGGPGWQRDCLPAAVHVAQSLDEAIEQMLAAAGR